jgi:prepilin-type N-terminal cleavage/methylation domain-containing protein
MKIVTGNKRGVTLVELIAAIGILAIVAGSLFIILTSGIKNFGLNVTNAKSQAGLRTAMVHITRNERKAEAITPGASSLTLTIASADNVYSISGNWLVYNGNGIAENIKGISSHWVTENKILSVTLTAADGTTLTTQMHFKD